MTSKSTYPRGSEWRKWELHLHAPGTKKNDGYKGTATTVWNEYCRRLEESDVQAFGITDYFSFDGYFDALREFRARYPGSAKVLFANVELATNDVVNKQSEEVNVHIIFNPALSEEKCREFLANLETTITDAKGRRFKASELKTQADFERATTTRAFILDALERTFGAKAELTDHVLIVTAVNNDGIRPQRGVMRKAAASDELDKFSHGFFGNSNNTAYYLDPFRLDSGDEIDPKPVIAGSDAHSLNDLDEWLGKVVYRSGALFKQCTWIKADLTFEGLRQIIFESAERIYIGEEPEIEVQVRNNPRRYLKELRIDHAEGYGYRFGCWFKDERIPLNKELIAVIGNKGSGKSALTDILGLLGNSHNQKYERGGKTEELFSFLNKEKFLKGNCASNFFGQIEWYAGTPDRAPLDGGVDKSLPERLEYLPQKYLEKICANIDDDEFRSKLDQVIFGYVSEDDRFGAESLQELVTYLTSQETEDIAAVTAVLHGHNVKAVQVEAKVSPEYAKETATKLTLKEAEVLAHNGARPEKKEKPPEADASATEEIRILDSKIRELNEKIAQYEREKPQVARQAEDLQQARQAIERQANVLRALELKYRPLFEGVGVAFADIVQVTTDFTALDVAIQTQRNRVNELVSLLRTREDINAARFLAVDGERAAQGSVVCQREVLERKRAELIDRLSKPGRDYELYLRQEQEWQERHNHLCGSEDNPSQGTLNWLKQELKRIADVYPGELRAARAERDRVSREIFKKKKKLVDFYTAVKQSIDKEITRYKNDLQGYAISIEATLRLDPVFHEEFFRFISQAVKGSFYGGEDGKTQLTKLTDEVVRWDDEDEVFQFLAKVLDYLDFDRRPNVSDRARDIFKQVREKRDPVEFYDFLFGFSYLKSKYDLKVDRKDLSELSPGERGGLLLVFYLMLDKRQIPLVIDQPEDNLDNKSVYEILVTFLKKAKKRRQIILATHNPNLAVVADAEQIIHVTIDKAGQGDSKNDFSFRSGGIEDPVINRAVVDVLEGTLPAFDNRRLKYRKHPRGRTRPIAPQTLPQA